MQSETWQDFTEIYSSLFSVDPRIVNLIAVDDILILIVSGYSNDTVSKRLDMDVDYVSEVSKEFLNFPGFDNNQDINPYFAFRRSTSYDDFVNEVRIVSSTVLDKDLILWYTISMKYDILRKEIEDFYEQ